MTRIKIDSIDTEIVVPETLWVTAIAGLICGVGGLIVGFIVGVCSDLVSLYKGDY
mgnify:CR=1 FL=1